MRKTFAAIFISVLGSGLFFYHLGRSSHGDLSSPHGAEGASDDGGLFSGFSFPGSSLIHKGRRHHGPSKQSQKSDHVVLFDEYYNSSKVVDNIVFVRCFKVAGGSMMDLLRKECARRNLTLVPSSPDSPKIITTQYGETIQGTYNVLLYHAEYSSWMHRVVPNAVFLAFVRDPLDRAISHFYHFNPLSRVMNFQQFYRNRDAIQKKYGGKNSVLFKDNLMSVFLGYSQEEDITTENLQSRYHFIGLQEKFNESMVILHHVLGWNISSFYYRYTHLNKDKEPVRPSEAFKKVFQSKNVLDYKLYEASKTIFESYSQRFPNLAKETRAYVRLLNKKSERPAYVHRGRVKKGQF
eukprot:TRINITY_DN8258_c0_g1_i1.p1 TRINITY_DN8258_c0_g1~~TRINITY_DN8258_c0_g1_i1.p1  ORF type:complete len:351 (+),score=43.36 TRINITY_DN8258_c0_g1_i1:64-1116(+)